MRKAELVTGIAVYTREGYEKLLEISDDRETMNDSWIEWKRKKEELKQFLKNKGMVVKDVPVDIPELADYCKKNRLPNIGKNRAQFVQEKVSSGKGKTFNSPNILSVSSSAKDDTELFKLMKSQLFSAVIGDVMDKLGLLHQFLSPQIKALRADMLIVGRAMPVLEADVFLEKSASSANPIMKKPFGLMLEALDDLKPNEVYICTGSSPKYALWGELMSTRAIKLGAAGAVLDGFHRDTKGILNLNFPTFSYGNYAQDQGPRGKVIDFRCPIEMNGVKIKEGDIVFGDIDGVCIIPKEVEDEVVRLALEKVNGEKLVQKAIQNGMSACDAFKKYGIM